MEEIFLILLGIAWAVGTPIVAIVALVRTSRLRDQNERLRGRSRGRCQRQIGGSVAPPPVDRAPFAAPRVQEPIAEPPPAPPLRTRTGARAWSLRCRPAPAPAVGAGRRRSRKVGWEQRLGARAFLWIGAVTLALAAVFLVRYSIEEGYLSPEVRVILAALFGFALIGGAERMRSRDDRVAQALAAAGVAALYGALFSAVALYGMISKVAAGGGAAALTAFAIGVSLRHGIFVGGAGLRRRLRQSRHHRQRDAQHAGPVRLSAGDRRRHAVASSASAAGGRSAGACWRARRSGR